MPQAILTPMKFLNKTDLTIAWDVNYRINETGNTLLVIYDNNAVSEVKRQVYINLQEICGDSLWRIYAEIRMQLYVLKNENSFKIRFTTTIS